MAEKAGKPNSMHIRVLINKKTQRILYAEAGKDFVDLLFSFLLIPSGTVVKIFSDTEGSNSVGCITNIYSSVEKLSLDYMDGDKSDLLRPKIATVASGSASNALPIQHMTPVTYYVCSNHVRGGYCSYCSRYIYVASSGQHRVSTQSGQTCSCGEVMQTEVKLVNPDSDTSDGGFVKETITYIITDDLSIKPNSTITCITLLNNFNFTDLTELEERKLTVGPDEALDLLKASLVSKTALNDVFSDRLKIISMINQLAKLK